MAREHSGRSLGGDRTTVAGRGGDRPTDWATGELELEADTELRPHRVVEGEARWSVGYEHDEGVARSLRFRKILLWGGLAWLSLLPTDLGFNLIRGSDDWLPFVVARILAAIPLALLWLRLGRTPIPGRRARMLFECLAVSSVAAATAFMALRSGGLASPFLAALLPILVVRAIAIPDRWRRGLPLACAPVLVFWAVMGAGMISTPQALESGSTPIWAMFIFHLGTQIVTIAIVTIGGHVAWAVRRNLYKARTVGRYELLRPLGRGAMGEVWAAWHHALRQEVALKVLPVNDDGSARLRFEREVAATTKLRHPNSVRVYDFGLTRDGLWYYAMELLEGETLAELIARDGPLSIARALDLLRQAARALHEAHGQGIVHRDIKPENLFVSTPAGERDVIKVLDFGVASVAVDVRAYELSPTEPLRHRRDHEPPTEPGFGPPDATSQADRAVGTPLYISPEVALGGDADPRSDIYALGCVLYFMLTARPVFVERDVQSLLRAHALRSPAPPSTLLSAALPDYVEKVVMRCLAKDPQRRYEDADALVQAIDLCVRLGDNDRRRGGGESQQPRLRASVEQIEGWAQHSSTETDMTLLGTKK